MHLKILRKIPICYFTVWLDIFYCGQHSISSATRMYNKYRVLVTIRAIIPNIFIAISIIGAPCNRVLDAIGIRDVISFVHNIQVYCTMLDKQLIYIILLPLLVLYNYVLVLSVLGYNVAFATNTDGMRVSMRNGQNSIGYRFTQKVIVNVNHNCFHAIGWYS